MTESVKRQYDSTRRQEQAAATRSAILNAAQAAFLEQGYDKTTIRAVARTAGVSDQTVYNSFGDKAGLLYAVGLRLVALGEEGVSGDESQAFLAIRREPDVNRRIAMGARWMRETYESGMAQIERMIFESPTDDPRLAELAQLAWEQKRSDLRHTCEVLFGSDLDRSLDVDEVADFMLLLDSGATYSLLVERLGWTGEQYERWLARTMRNTLLRSRD